MNGDTTVTTAIAHLLTPEERQHWKLAWLSTVDHKRIGVLYMVVSVTLSLGMIVINSVNDVRDWQSQTTECDFVIRPMFADPNSGASVEPIPEEYRATLAAMNGVNDIDSLRLISGSVREQPVFIAIHEFQGKNREQLRLVLQNGDPDEVRRRVIDGEVVIGSNLAQRVGVHPGEYLDIEVGDRDKTTKSFRTGSKPVRRREFAIRLGPTFWKCLRTWVNLYPWLRGVGPEVIVGL